MIPLVALLLSAPPATWPGFGGPTRDFTAPALPADLPPKWRRPLGPGDSGVVTDGTTVFTLDSVPDPADKKRGQEVAIAVDAATGVTRWEHKNPVAMLAEQETFRGDPIGPQATPLLVAGRLVTLGYAGVLHALDPATGKVVWTYDLVADFAATPVQFGPARPSRWARWRDGAGPRRRWRAGWSAPAALRSWRRPEVE